MKNADKNERKPRQLTTCVERRKHLCELNVHIRFASQPTHSTRILNDKLERIIENQIMNSNKKIEK
ncbi:CLUMA_CG017945, isoform A [Clunio marinus]|uniref:CLUMA_CG017945, isoform A n=1 Tax=Clunio marinus TaxID=568069 RepID=A0A1J1J0F3_9DIPT|nr:CLUMA_CG017945, isoform A [Clunio marinus]